MGKLTQKQILKHYLTDEWVPGFKLVGIDTPYGFLGAATTRRLRELAEAGEIERKLIGKFVNYRAKQESKLISRSVWRAVERKPFLTRLTKTPSLF